MPHQVSWGENELAKVENVDVGNYSYGIIMYAFVKEETRIVEERGRCRSFKLVYLNLSRPSAVW